VSHIDDLIAKFCPGGVELKALGEIGELVRGNGLPKTDFTESGVGAIHYGQIYTHYGTWTTRTISFVAPKTASRLAKVDPGDIVITNTSETLEDVCKAVAWLGDEQIVTGGHATVLKHKQEPKYLAYWLQSPAFQAQKNKLATGVKVIDVSAKSLATIKIPVPPVEVQREIVRMLDLLTMLETELEAELEARRRQYGFYRGRLLAELQSESVSTTLGDICSQVFSGGTPLSTRREYYNGDIPWLRTQEVRYLDIFDTEVKITQAGLNGSAARWVPVNSVIVAISGAGVTRGRVTVNKIPLTTNQHCCSLVIDPAKANYRFVYYWLVDRYEELRLRGQGNRSDLNMGIVKAFPIVLPSLAEQNHIVAALENFDALVHDMTIGLPAELAGRRKQYEYYRDRLLTFKELAA
jgi:type I restriction enzyme S subunit